MTWSELRIVLETEKRRRRLPWYERQVRELSDAGFRLATDEMAELYARIVGGPNDYGEMPYYSNRKSTYPIIGRTEPNDMGFYAYGTHDRGEDIAAAIDSLADLHASDIAANKAWLMPVRDDGEYVSWDFDVMVGTEQEVLLGLADSLARTGAGSDSGR